MGRSGDGACDVGDVMGRVSRQEWGGSGSRVEVEWVPPHSFFLHTYTEGKKRRNELQMLYVQNSIFLWFSWIFFELFFY